MARFQNGLHFGPSYAKSGKQLSRWMFEFATQILGWDGYDDNDVGWTSVQGSGVDAATHVSDPSILDFSGSAYTLTAANVGSIVTMLGNAGWSDSEKETIGMYKIIYVDAATEYAYLDIKRGVHEDGLPLGKSSVGWRIWDDTDTPATGTWGVIRSQYLHAPAEPNMDVLITEGNGDDDNPFVAIGPFGTWDGVGNSWADSRNTTNRTPYTSGSTDRYIFAYGDETDNDHFVVGVYDRTMNRLVLYYIGAIDPTAGTLTDTNPGVIVAGSNSDDEPALGNGNDSDIDIGGRMMAYNGGGNDVEIAPTYLIVPSVCPRDANSIFDNNLMWSSWSGSRYRIEIMLQSQTAGHMEARGVLKSLWMGGGLYSNLIPFGTTPDFFLHLNGGLSMPWNGSEVHVQWNRSP